MALFGGKSAGGMPDETDDDDNFDDLSVDSFLADPDDDNDEVVGTETFEIDDAESDEESDDDTSGGTEADYSDADT